LATIVIILYLVIGKTNKTQLLIMIVPILYLLSIRFYRKIISSRFIRNFIAITLLLSIVIVSGIYKRYRSYQVMNYFANSMSIDRVKAGLINPDSLFATMADQSSAHRIFEYVKVQQAISNNIGTLIFGLGLGGSVDMSGSKDKSVLGTYGETISNVRVFHLMLVYMLAKFGLLGIVFTIIGIFWLAKQLLWNIRHYNLIQLIAVCYLLSVSVGIFVTFSVWIKQPLVGVMIWILSKRSQLIEIKK
jgi:hypothetical protein